MLGLDGWEGSTILIHGGDGGVTLINVAEEKVVSLHRSVLCRFKTLSVSIVCVSDARGT